MNEVLMTIVILTSQGSITSQQQVFRPFIGQAMPAIMESCLETAGHVKDILKEDFAEQGRTVTISTSCVYMKPGVGEE